MRTGHDLNILVKQVEREGCPLAYKPVELLRACQDSRLWTATISKTPALLDDRRAREALADWIGSHPSRLALPVFCVAECDGVRSRCEMIWVRKDVRRLGLASVFVDRLRFSRTAAQVPSSKPFWAYHNLSDGRP